MVLHFPSAAQRRNGPVRQSRVSALVAHASSHFTDETAEAEEGRAAGKRHSWEAKSVPREASGLHVRDAFLPRQLSSFCCPSRLGSLLPCPLGLLEKHCLWQEGRRPAQRRATRWGRKRKTRLSRGPGCRPSLMCPWPDVGPVADLAARESERCVCLPGCPGQTRTLAKGRRGRDKGGRLCCVCLIFYDVDGDHYTMIIVITMAVPCLSPARHQPQARKALSPTPVRHTHTHTHTHACTQTPQDGLPSPHCSYSRHRSQRLTCQARDTRAKGPGTCPDRVPSPAPPPAAAPAGTAILRAAGWQVAPRDGAVLT